MAEKTEFEEIFGDEFFVIDSENLDEINGRLYGFSINDGILVENENYNNQQELTGEGAYVYISIDNDTISIFQDFMGSYGLYLFTKNDYFAISNSFLKLVEHLKYKYKLTLNKEFASSLIVSNLCSHIYKETLINEIELLPRNIIIHINKSNKTFSYEQLNYGEKTIDLNSKESLTILDNWFEKWVSVIRFLKVKTNNIQFDLSGGFDSRIIIALLICANIDFDKVLINSIEDNLHSHKEDFEIANNIANEFNFRLNKKPFILQKEYFKDITTIISASAYLKLGFHNQFNFKFFRTDEKFYHFSGAAGESIRAYVNKVPNELKKSIWNFSNKENQIFRNDCDVIFQRTLENLANDFDIVDLNSKDLSFLVYFENRWRHHFGKLTVEENITNQKKLNPFLDPELQKLKLSTEKCSDWDLLISLIFVRYCPKLLNFKFEGGRKINENTIKYAEYLNNLYPYIPKDYEYISGPPINLKKQDSEIFHHWDEVNLYLKEIFESRYFEMEFKKFFSIDLYNNIINSIKIGSYFPIQYATPIFSILKILDDIKSFDMNNNFDFNNWIKRYHENYSESEINSYNMDLLLNYITARVDIKNRKSSKNSIEIIEISDKNSNMDYPSWFNKGDGDGLVLTSKKGEINFKLKCINDGNLIIWLRGIDIRDRNNNRFPIYINFTEFSINKKSILDNEILVSHDTPFVFSMNVDDSEILNIHIKWEPFSESSVITN